MSSTVTLADLLVTDPRPARTAAAAWRTLSNDLDRAADTLNRNTRDLGAAWFGGQAAGAAEKKVNALRDEVNAAYNPAMRISRALSDHADAMSDLRSQAETVVGSARAKGFEVDAVAGRVAIPAKLLAPPQASTAPPDPGRIRAQAQEIANSLATLVSRARGLDDSTVDTIRQNLPDPATGFGALSLPPVTRDTVLAQRGRNPKDVNDWWRSLTPAQRDQAIADYPELVGWLDGVPADDRNRANRLRLDHDRANLDRRAADLQREIDAMVDGYRAGQGVDANRLARLRDDLDEVNRQRQGLDLVKRRLDDLGDQGYLLGIDPAVDGKAIVAVGNPDTATDIATYVPGTGAGFVGGEGFAGSLDRTKSMADDARLMAPKEQTSVVLWIGYDAPDNAFLNSPSGSYADDAAADLRRFQGGLRATHEAGDATQTVLGHSYGTTVIGHAASGGHSLDADQVILVASPGTGVDHATDLHLRNGDASGTNVWSTTAPNDPVQYSPVHGNDPTEDDFGGNVFTSDPGSSMSHAHSEYWDEGKASRDAIAALIVGKSGTFSYTYTKVD